MELASIRNVISANNLGIIRQPATRGLSNFLQYASWETSPQPLQKWSCTANLTVLLGNGSGQFSTPFSVTAATFSSICADFGFSQRFLWKLAAKASLFEHIFDRTDTLGKATEPSYLEVAVANFEIDGFFCVMRYDIKKSSAQYLIFLKSDDGIRKTPLLVSDLLLWLEENKELLQRHPLLVLNVLMEFIQFRSHEYVRWRLELYNLESRLGVTREGEALRLGGFEDVDHDFAILNADLAGLAHWIAFTGLSASTILEHAKSFQRLVKLCEECETPASGRDQSQGSLVSEQWEEIQDTITRAELYLMNVKMAHDILQSLSAVLYNRINKQDTNSMKTIAVVTLVFLPATFVSAIFSTGIFNFHASESPDNPRTISKYGWVYLVVCVLSTALTLLFWVCWYRWGRVWLETVKFSRIQSHRKTVALSIPQNAGVTRRSRGSRRRHQMSPATTHTLPSATINEHLEPPWMESNY